MAAQRRLPECDTDRVVFAGAWHGWGFHEDGARSGVEAAARLGVDWAGDPRRCRSRPRRYATTIRHTRRTPFKRSFTHGRAPGWSTSTTCPTTACSARFEARDHLGDPERTT